LAEDGHLGTGRSFPRIVAADQGGAVGGGGVSGAVRQGSGDVYIITIGAGGAGHQQQDLLEMAAEQIVALGGGGNLGAGRDSSLVVDVFSLTARVACGQEELSLVGGIGLNVDVGVPALVADQGGEVVDQALGG